MRPGQKNNRGRGRNNNNRKPSNPLSRSYDSTGPDVKVRGNAQTVAEKYMALARDAQGSGDRVMAENYLQHAEHYNRIVAQGQAQLQERQQRDEAAREQQERDQQERAAETAENSDEAAEGVEAKAENADAEAGDAAQTADSEDKPRRNQRRRTGPRQRRPRANENGEDAAAKPQVEVVSEAPVEPSEPTETAPAAE
jgi:rubrerythrin